MLMRFCWPNESARGGISISLFRLTVSIAQSTFLTIIILRKFQVLRSKREFFAHRRSKQHLGWALKDISDRVGSLGNGHLARLLSFEQDASLGRLEQTQGVFDHGRFARTVMAQDGNDISGIDS